MNADPADTFRQEARELLETLEQGLLDLEKHPDDNELVNTVFRALHTLKGSGAMFGFLDVAGFVHEFETAFDGIRKGRTAATPELIGIALDAKDHVACLIEGAVDKPEAGELILSALRNLTDDTFPVAPVAAAPIPSPPPGMDDAKRRTWRIVFRLPADCMLNGTNPLLLLDEIRQIGPCTVTALTDRVPVIGEIDPEQLHLGWQVDIEAEDPRGALNDVFLFLIDDMELHVEPLNGAETTARPAETGPAPPATQPDEARSDRFPTAPTEQPDTTAQIGGHVMKAAEKPNPTSEAPPAIPKESGAAGMSLRVPAERLDELMDRVGELVIAQSRLQLMASESNDLGLRTIAEELERLSAGLRDTTMGIRMVPIGSLFSRFRRLIHDLSHDLGKEIEFVTNGEETELDKTMIERLADPLVHLIRNAVDHGIEDADTRVRAGKKAKGVVRLEAVYAGAEVAILVSDDGAGLDIERIRAKAEEAGFLMPETRISDHDLSQMIFAPGFSTVKEVTALSGRGVGMDVVKRTIDGLRGSVELSSEKGKGTRVSLRLPLTLAIIDGMLVRVGTGRYTIPLSAVVECVETPKTVETSARGRSFLDIRGELVPFLSLREMFAASGEPETHQKVVIVQCGEEKVGLVVDQIIGNNQTVIKQLSKLHSGLKAFSGATILGDGTVALILDTVNLVNMGQAQTDRYISENRGRAA
ncbi:MAG: chemotaxis protein CheA [Alphaproteobacteria bacterium]|nr:chemotaxis protein CheA [Alphaproteobacteria bacterium]